MTLVVTFTDIDIYLGEIGHSCGNLPAAASSVNNVSYKCAEINNDNNTDCLYIFLYVVTATD